MVRSFQDLVVWQKAHKVVLAVYAATKTLPKDEIYGLTSQMRRAAVSVPANIAESFRKRSPADKARILNIAQGSLEEIRYFVILAADIYPGSVTPQLGEDIDEVARMLSAYIAAILSPSRPLGALSPES